MGTINITVISPPLPEGWQGTPDEFRAEIFSTLSFEGSGEFLTGQVGGAMPTEDVGLFIDGQDLYTWDEGTSQYKPITTQPVGSLLAHLGATAPTNYLACDGEDYAIEDYPELYTIIGDTYKRDSDSDTVFRVPDFRGRVAIGAGLGDYDPKETGILTGKMAELTLGDYGGYEWPRRITAKHPNIPPSNTNPGDAMVYQGVTGVNYTRAVPPNVAVLWCVRAR